MFPRSHITNDIAKLESSIPNCLTEFKVSILQPALPNSKILNIHNLLHNSKFPCCKLRTIPNSKTENTNYLTEFEPPKLQTALPAAHTNCKLHCRIQSFQITNYITKSKNPKLQTPLPNSKFPYYNITRFKHQQIQTQLPKSKFPYYKLHCQTQNRK